MSIQAIAWVLDHSQSTGTDRLVLIALANHYNSATGQCDPGQRQIAREANVSQPTVVRSVRRLVELGEIEARPGKGHGTTKYHLPWLSTDWPSDSPWVNHSRGPSDSRATRSDSSGPPSDSPRRIETYNRSKDQNREQNQPAVTQLGRDKDAPPLWEFDENGDAALANRDPGEYTPSSGPPIPSVRRKPEHADAAPFGLIAAREILREAEARSRRRHPSTGPQQE